MKRRAFLKTTALAVGASPFLGSGAVPAADQMSRIGCTTVTFRNRFASTRPKGLAPIAPGFAFIGAGDSVAETEGRRA